MINRDMVLDAFVVLGAAGLRHPSALDTPQSVARAADVWVDILNPIAPLAFRDAIKRHLRDPERGTYWPVPADILRHAEAIAAAAYPDAAEAFPRVLARRGSFGAHREDDALAQLAADGFPIGKIRAGIKALGGWESLGMIPDPRYGGDAVGHGIAGRTFADAYVACDASTALVKA